MAAAATMCVVGGILQVNGAGVRALWGAGRKL